MTAPKSQRAEAYRVVARRFRPVEFDDLVGQEHVLATLRGCLSQGRLPHAFLFCGSRGVGKTTTARILARAVNCESGITPRPCGECSACRSVLEGSASDVVELDAASNNGVDEVRALREQAGYAPIRLRRKVFILDEVHMFSKSAFNALLKILEEPPEHVLFVLATTEAHKVPETVRSRCQVLPFRRIQEADVRGRLQRICEREGVAPAPEVLAEIAASCMGGLRDAETALERILPLAHELDLDGYRRLVGRLGAGRAAELIGACLAGDERAALRYAAEAVETGVDERECLGEILEVLRQVFLLLVDGPDSVLVEADGEWRQRLAALAASTELGRVDAMMQLLILARERVRQLDDRRVLLELSLVRLARLGELATLGELLAGSPPTTAPATGTAQAMANDAWGETVATALAERPALGAVLEQASPRWDGADLLCLTFDRLKSMERSLLEGTSSRDYLQELLRRHADRSVQLRFEIKGSSAASKGQPTAAPARAAPLDELPPLGKAAAARFGASHIETDETERG